MPLECLFCGSDLWGAGPAGPGANDRLAFDAHLGRLWRVCPECLRWNLAPFEARWEVLEECERRARSAPVLLRTEHLELLAAGGGQLIRVGAPTRLEFADWRYSSRLDLIAGGRSRFERAIMSLPELPVGGYNFYGASRPLPEAWLGSPFIENGTLLSALFASVPVTEECPGCAQPLFIHPAAFGDLRLERVDGTAVVAVPCGLCGEEVTVPIREARPAIRAGLALVSWKYRHASHVQRAVGPLERMGGAHALLDRLCRRRAEIGQLQRAARLALWIALDELAEAEALEDEWQSAECLARIADEELTQIKGFEDFRRRVLLQH
ncbi:MAG TPA: hypothetical protein VK864_05460 [Longimicrobiales bacterium]|nr:hypothetical protein [Longimicrobiales bacterium]